MKAKKERKGKKRKRMILTFLAFLIAIISTLSVLPFVKAIGISPGRAMYDFEPNKIVNGTFSVINNEHKEMKVLLDVKGELNKSLILYNKLVEFKADEEEKTFSYTLKMPGSLKPGKHLVEIVALELPKELEKPGTFIGATVAVATQIYVTVPYPGKYAEARLSIKEAAVNETVYFFIELKNLGTEKIVRAKAIIDILGVTGEKIATIITNEKSLNAGQRTELIGKWKANVNPATYKAKVTVIYDGKTISLESNFNVGKPEIKIISIEVKNFRLGGIAKFEILIENEWGEEIKDVYARLIIYNEKNQPIADEKTASTDIKPLEKKVIFAYWDTEGVREGNYRGKIQLYYLDKVTEEELKAKIRIDSLIVEMAGITAEVVTTTTERKEINTLLVILILILILINVGWFLYLRKKK